MTGFYVFAAATVAFTLGWAVAGAIGYANGRSDQARLDETEIADLREKLTAELRKDVIA